MPILVKVTRGPGAGRAAEVRPGESLVVGRGSQSNFQILDEGLSRAHCRFFWEEGAPFVEDMGSKNGTLVNGDKIQRHRLSDGDLVGLGVVDLAVSLSGAGATKDKEGPQVLLVDPAAPSTVGVKRRIQMEQTLLFGGAKGAPAASVPPDMKRLQRDLATVYKVVNLFNTQSDLPRLFSLVMDTILEVTGADRGAILVKPEDGGPLRSAASKTRGKPGAKGEIPVSRTIVEEGLKGLSLITGDALSDERFRAGASIVLQNIQAAMCAPLESHDKILGVIYVDTTGGARRFSEADLELLSAIGKQAGIAIQRISFLQETRDLFYSTVKTLAVAIEAKDLYTKGHSERVTQFSTAIAEAMGLDAETVDTVRLSAILHDVGKIGVAESVLNKQGKLTDEEYAAIQAHPAIGAGIVQNIPRIGRVLDGVRHHHEKWAGKGYPDGLSGEAIPLVARIIAVADTYDAMSSHRPYRKGLEASVIFEEIRRNAGTQFDPACVEAFFKAVEAGKIPKPPEVLAEQASFQAVLKPSKNPSTQEVP